MYVAVDTTQGSAEVREASDLKQLSVRTVGPTDLASLSRGLGELGRVDSTDHAWIDISALRTASGRSGDAEWSSGFDAMIAYATTKGWVDEAGAAVRAHIEPDPAGA